MDSKLQNACVATMACVGAYCAYKQLTSPRASPTKAVRKSAPSAPRTRAHRIPSNTTLATSIWNAEIKSTGMEGRTEEQILAELNAKHDDQEVCMYVCDRSMLSDSVQ